MCVGEWVRMYVRPGRYQKVDDGMVLILNITVLLNITILPFHYCVHIYAIKNALHHVNAHLKFCCTNKILFAPWL